VMVTAPTIAMAWDDLYYLERAAEVQVKAMSTGRPLRAIPPALAQKTHAQMRPGDGESGRLHLDAVRRLLMREQPEFAV
jgi:ribulose-5-phosphate 4-epimerase/fuculose-1-phosphate aldolase